MALHLVPMSIDRLGPWLHSSAEAYRLDRIEAGESAELAGHRAAEVATTFFPGGVPLPSHQVFDLVVGEEIVGWLWIGPQRDSTTDWWVWEIEIDARFRRRGHARAALALAEDEARRSGAGSIGLNVFGANRAAWALYESSGYRLASATMTKALGPQAPATEDVSAP